MPNIGINAGVSMNTLKSRILNPAFTSVYSVLIQAPSLVSGGEGGSSATGLDRELFELTCIEASLPGSSIATVETNRDYHGIVERHAYSRLFDETIELTFLVTLDSNYRQIRFFDFWMKYIVGENTYTDKELRNKVNQRAKYPDSYKTGMKIAKFEKDLGSGKSAGANAVVYNFVDVFPKSMNSIPIAYESSQLLKVTVSMCYTRYFIDRSQGQTDNNFNAFGSSSLSPGNPEVPFDFTFDSDFSSTRYYDPKFADVFNNNSSTTFSNDSLFNNDFDFTSGSFLD